MRSFRVWFRLWGAVVAAVAAAGLIAMLASAASAAEFKLSEFVSATCKTDNCSEPYTQAAGHPNVGLTVFKLASEGSAGKEVPSGGLAKNLRVDVPVGLSVSPGAVPQCKMAEFEGIEVAKGAYTAPACASDTILGVNMVVVAVEVAPNTFVDVELTGDVYNLVQPEGVPAEFGVALSLEPLGPTYKGVYAHTLLEGGVSWHKENGLNGRQIENGGDYHEYFKIHDLSEELPLLKSTLIYNGQTGKGFLTVPSACTGPQTSAIEVESNTGTVATDSFTTPLGAEGCNLVKFEPSVALEPGTTQPDLPDAATVKVKVPQNEVATEIDSSTLKESTIVLPEGMTFNPAAANGLVACTDAQFAMGSAAKVDCPEASQIGTAEIVTPTLPGGGPLKGAVYVGEPVSGKSPSSGQEYRIFIDAESARYGLAVRLEGKVSANESTGQLSTVVAENPQLPFSEFILAFTGGKNGGNVPLANPLACGTANSSASLLPYTGQPAALPPITPFEIACTSTPFSPEQTTEALPGAGGSTSSFTIKLTRSDGQQYLRKISAELPLGMVAKIPSASQCGEPAAKEGTCPEASKIGIVEASVGAGATPYPLAGSVYLTGPYKGAPFGLSIVVPATKVGPYDYGNIVTQAGISIDPYTTRVTVAGELPTIVGGVPLRLKALTIDIKRGNFMLNPTSCEKLSTNTTLTSTAGATDTIATPFQATGCGSLGFKPQFSYSTNAYTTKRFGASLNVKLAETAGDANIKSVSVTLPMKLPSRTSTLKQACLEATFAANPASCPAGSKVGTAKVTTPTLPGTLEGPAYFVSHGGAAFPDLDLVLKGDGVTVILVGNTNISKNITHTTFATLPDVPVNSFELNLPTGENSALAANGDFCKGKMYMPTTVVGQNGKTINEKIQIQVAECPVRVVGQKVSGSSATITAAVSSAGRLSTSGQDLVVIHKQIAKAVGNAKIAVQLSSLGRYILATTRQIDVKVRVGFKASTGAKRESKAFVNLVFRS